MLLSQALRLQAGLFPDQNPLRAALVGAGGKTTALFNLAEDLLDHPYPSILLTTTTHLARHQADLAQWQILTERSEDLLPLRQSLPAGIGLVAGLQDKDGRIKALPGHLLEELYQIAEDHQVPLLIEADGSRLKPVKAPGSHEPVIPPFVNYVLVICGLSALAKPLEAEWVHRPERFAALAGLLPGQNITPEALYNVLNHPQGGLKNIPPNSRRILVLNQVQGAEMQRVAASIAMPSLDHYDSVLLADLGTQQKVLSVFEPVAGIILAAGEASRFGQPKQLLDWQGHPLVRHVALTALQAGCSPVSVVVGAYATQVQHALEGLPVQVIHNHAWKAGQASSVKIAVRALPAQTGSAVFLLADQPQVSVELVQKLMSLHHQTLAPLTAPRVAGKRANPVLFDRVTFPDLLLLEGDTGGRILFSQGKFQVAWLDWSDPALLQDIDTPQDYQQFTKGAN